MNRIPSLTRVIITNQLPSTPLFAQRRHYGLKDAFSGLLNDAGSIAKISQMLSQTYDGASRDNSVRITIKGDDSVVKVEVDDSVLRGSKSQLEAQIAECVTDAFKKVFIL